MSWDLTRLQVRSAATLRDALFAIDREASGFVFVVNESEKVVGMLTDGDIRRAILSGAALTDSVTAYMNKGFTYGRSDRSRQINLAKIHGKIRHLPILDSNDRLVDLLSSTWRLPVMSPHFAGNEMTYVTDCIRSNWVSSQGNYVKLFEKNFAEYLGARHALTCSSGTTALHLALLALDIKQGDEVIVPDLTFAATANVVLHAGATPVFVDVSKDHWTMDPEAIESAITKNTKAIMPVHLYGHPCDMDPILEITKQRNLFIIEDCAEVFMPLHMNC